MLTTEHPWTSAMAPSISPTYALRLQSGAGDERLIAIPLGKHSIGSGPRCSLRLQHEGVQPLECLIVHDETGLRVRSWSENTLVNGERFDDTRLTAGDVLRLGPVELEVVEPSMDEVPGEESEEPADRWELEGEITESTSLLVDEPATEDWPAVEEYCSECQLSAPADADSQVASNADWEPCSASDVALAPNENVETEAIPGTDGEESEPKNARPAGKRRNRRVLAALHRQRREYGELTARVNDLVEKIEQALSATALSSEPVSSGIVPPETLSAPAQDSKLDSMPDPRIQELESEVGGVREQLAARDAELNQARYSIDVLERQLIDSQHTMHAFADERLTWEKQFDELESRLAEYVGRIQELERQLDQVRTARTAEVPAPSATTTDLAVEAASDEAPSVQSSEDIIDADVVATALEPSPGDSIESGATWAEINDEPARDEAAMTAPETIAPTAEVADGDEAGVDAALDHLRGLSIWREEPGNSAETGGRESLETSVEESGTSKGPEPASFIDRYAHLFPSDDASEMPTHSSPMPAPVTPIVPVAAATHDAGGDEESVEQYMAKLLERMRGPAAVERGASEPTTDAETTASLDSTVSEVCGDDTAPPNPEPITELTELKSKPSVAEQAKDRIAMRELANQSARHAIGVHTARKLRRSARTRCIVALLGAAVGFYLLLDAPGWKSLQFAAGCVAAFAALYWGKLTFSTLIQGIRIGAFDHFDEEIDPEKALHPPLPIDVEPHPQTENSVEPSVEPDAEAAAPDAEPALVGADAESAETA